MQKVDVIKIGHIQCPNKKFVFVEDRYFVITTDKNNLELKTFELRFIRKIIISKDNSALCIKYSGKNNGLVHETIYL